MSYAILSTASFCLWDIAASEKLEICSNLNFEEIQVALSSEKMVHDFLNYIKTNRNLFSFRKISIHAPWCRVTYSDTLKTKRILDALTEIHSLLNLDTIIFRVDCIAKLNLILETGLPVSIENSNREGSWAHLHQIAQTSNVPIVLNLNRALREHDYLDEMLRTLGHRISRILISGYTQTQGRMPILFTNQLHLLDRISSLNAPLVLEGLFEPGNITSIIEERDAVLGYMGMVR